MKEFPQCPLCSSGGTRFQLERDGIRYFHCSRCELLFVDPVQRPDFEEERRRYESHRNRPTDPAYRRFLRRLADPVMERVAPGSTGLDYGSGPGPTLSRILTEAGRPTRDYDPFFAPDRGALGARYDFVTCSETAEHFHNPGVEFRRIDGLLRPGGWFGLMTGIVGPETDLVSWWYLRDPTHVAFYSAGTLAWIGGELGWTLALLSDTVALFQKKADWVAE